MTVGDIHWVDLPAETGREQRGRRPAVILQDEGDSALRPCRVGRSKELSLTTRCAGTGTRVSSNRH